MAGDLSEMFEAMYAGAEAGGARPPWDHGAARPQLVEWVEAQDLTGDGREALVVGCGYGADAELLQRLGFRTTAFDFSATAVAAARKKHPASEVTGPPWPLTRAEVEAFAGGDVVLRHLEQIEGGTWWRAELSVEERGRGRGPERHPGRRTPGVTARPEIRTRGPG